MRSVVCPPMCYLVRADVDRAQIASKVLSGLVTQPGMLQTLTSTAENMVPVLASLLTPLTSPWSSPPSHPQVMNCTRCKHVVLTYCCLLSVVCCLLSVVCWLLAVGCWLSSVVCCLLSVVCCLLVRWCVGALLLLLLSLCCCLLSVVCCSLLLTATAGHISTAYNISSVRVFSHGTAVWPPRCTFPASRRVQGRWGVGAALSASSSVLDIRTQH
jgi:hypothetical protein